MTSNLLTENHMSEPSTPTDINTSLTPQYIWNERFKSEAERLKTFENWPLEWLHTNVLAATGMFYTGMRDTVKCYFCEVVIGLWEQGDDPVQEHIRWSRNCPLMQRRTTDNIPLSENALDLVLGPVKDITYDTPPSTNWKPVACYDYSIKAVRLYTFADWPRSIKQKPAALVEAGFYYKGVGDCVICFSCLGGLKDWEEDDDPWEQHALWMGHHCSYVKLVKGEDYIKSVYDKYKNYYPNESDQNTTPNQATVQQTAQTSESEDLKLCKICYDKECNTAYIPCGHVVACTDCALSAKECPMCRSSITNVIRLFFS